MWTFQNVCQTQNSVCKTFITCEKSTELTNLNCFYCQTSVNVVNDEVLFLSFLKIYILMLSLNCSTYIMTYLFLAVY